MKTYLVRSLVLCLSVAFAFSTIYAQDETLAAAAGDKYLISAKAGGVNYVEGSVTVLRKAGRSGQLLKGDTLEIGDRVSTGTDGKAEILLNPGSFVRLGGNTVFEFVTTTLDDLQLKLNGGSAIFEVFAGDEFQVLVKTPNSKYLLVATGVYRVDVLGAGSSRLEVWKGTARVDGSLEIVKGGRAVTTSSNGRSSIAKFDRDEKDALDLWSRFRGKELARISKSLQRESVRTALMRGLLGRRWNLYSSFGLWVYNPFYGTYCFLPFGWGWNSPYGFGFGHNIWWYNIPHTTYWPHHGGGNNSGGGGNSGGGSQPTITPIVTAGTRAPIPPFIRMQETMGGGTRGVTNDSSSYDSGSSYTPSSSSSSSSSSSAPPAPVKSDPPPPTKQP